MNQFCQIEYVSSDSDVGARRAGACRSKVRVTAELRSVPTAVRSVAGYYLSPVL